jgi:hypothetical protein
MAQFLKLSVFIKNQFFEGHAPSRKTLKKLILSNELPGKIIGTNYFVDLQKFNLTGDNLVDSVLLAS